MTARVKSLALIPTIFLTALVHAGESAQQVMARMAAHQAVKISYTEKRYLDLLDEPWSGSGYFYAKAPAQLVKLQLSPERIVMAADNNSLWYYDANRGLRHASRISEDDAASMGVASFQALINGNLKRLKSLYQLQFNTGNGFWSLLLLPKPDSEAVAALPHMEISGRDGAAAQKIVVQETGGDHSEYVLGESAKGLELDKEISTLLKEAQGRH